MLVPRQLLFFHQKVGIIKLKNDPAKKLGLKPLKSHCFKGPCPGYSVTNAGAGVLPAHQVYTNQMWHKYLESDPSWK